METSKAVNLLSIGLLDQFSSLKELEVLLTQLLGKQNEMLENELKNLSFEQLNEGKEVSMMVSCRKIPWQQNSPDWLHHVLDEKDESLSP